MKIDIFIIKKKFLQRWSVRKVDEFQILGVFFSMDTSGSRQEIEKIYWTYEYSTPLVVGGAKNTTNINDIPKLFIRVEESIAMLRHITYEWLYTVLIIIVPSAKCWRGKGLIFIL